MTLTDPAGNVVAPVTATAILDKTPPPPFTVTPDETLINAAEAKNFGITFSGAEANTTYTYTISSTGGTNTVTDSWQVFSPNQQITGIDVSGLADGTLTITVVLTDEAGNQSVPVIATAILDKTPPPPFTIILNDTLINASNEKNVGFTFVGAEANTTYTYTITSDGGPGVVTGSWQVFSSNQQLTGIDVSSLADGNLTFTVVLTDEAGNVSAPRRQRPY